MSGQAPLSSVPPPVKTNVNKPDFMTTNPMPDAVKPAEPGLFGWLFGKPNPPKNPLSSTAPTYPTNGGRRRNRKKTHRKNRAKKTRRRH